MAVALVLIGIGLWAVVAFSSNATARWAVLLPASLCEGIGVARLRAIRRRSLVGC
jgi:hypothetical protein